MSATLHSLIAAGAAAHHPALLALGRAPLPYPALLDQIAHTGHALRAAGVQPGDRAALVLPNGPDAATAFLGAACAAAAAPLNPAYRAAEFDFYLGDLDAKALIVQQGVDTPAREVALARGIPLLELTPQAAAGSFTLSAGGARREAARPPRHADSLGYAQPADTALVLHTSGTTARPKIVPLTHANLAASARNIAHTLALSSADRCLNVMPLFHIHGLAAALLASLSAGASVVCTPGFQSADFFGWLDEFRPSWYTAVPTMHQSILIRAASHAAAIARAPLRFVRSSSAPLPPLVMAGLQAAFGCPVIEAYGMTEAAHQMASNPLDGARKPGSVGLPAGPAMAIMAQDAPTLLPPGSVGEIVIRGANVTPGYAANPAANAQAFTDGWFRTGDQGYTDADGYFFITGRIKEIINRGGEKIAPREVDEALLDHPAVAQAVAFAVPHPELGEEVAAAVVLRDASVTASDLRHFAAKTLADFKIPRKILIVDEIPKGATGKVQRIGLAEKLGLTGPSAPPAPHGDAPPPEDLVPPGNPVEAFLLDIWREVLKVDNISVTRRFLEAGGDSLTAVQLVSRVRTALGIELSLVDFFDAPTIRAQAQVVEARLLG
jgi:acyl-CoA synthetase (AMP-forming)/AMP-acid ligase II/acyl carrier protein